MFHNDLSILPFHNARNLFVVDRAGGLYKGATSPCRALALRTNPAWIIIQLRFATSEIFCSPMPGFHHIPANNTTPRLFWILTLALIAMACLPTVWPDLDLEIARWFAPPEGYIEPKSWWWVLGVNLYVPAVFRWMVVMALGLWVIATMRVEWKAFRLPLAFFILSGALGPGLIVNSGFKEHWQRARPYEVVNFGGTDQFTRAGVITDQCHNNCSFVSGHVSCGFFFASLMLIQPRRRRLWAVVGCAAGAAIAFARMADMAHWLSDTLWAAPITWACSWLVWRALVWVYKEPDKPS